MSQLRSWYSLSDEVFYHLSIWEVLPHGLNRSFSFKSAGVEEWPIYTMRKNKRETIKAGTSMRLEKLHQILKAIFCHCPKDS